MATHAIDAFNDVGDELGLARAWRLVAQAHYLARRAGLCVEASERALVHARMAGDQLEVREIVEWLCVALMLGPTPATEVATRCEALLEDLHGDAHPRTHSSRCPRERPGYAGPTGTGRWAAGKMARECERVRRFDLAVRDQLRVDQLSILSPQSGSSDLDTTLSAGLARRATSRRLPDCSRAPLCAQTRYDEADALTRESEEAARPNDIHSHILWRTARAQVLAHRGQLESAEALALEAVAFADDSDFLDSHADALMILADVRAQAGRIKDAIADAGRALELYEQKGNVISAERSRSRLSDLEATASAMGE